MSVTYKAILVGNSEFPEDPHGLPKLNGPTNDVFVLKKALCNPEKGLFKEENVTTLLNAKSFEILAALEQFFNSLTHNDQSLFYYSGHGLHDIMNRLYLGAKNSKKDALISTTIPAISINNLLESCATRKHILILDCCHSGSFKGGNLPQTLQGEGRFVITSSSSVELTTDADSPKSPSPFTKHLTDALLTDNVDGNEDGYVSINEVYDYVYEKVRLETKQRPQRKFGDTSGDLPLCKRKPSALNKTKKTKAENKTMNLGSGKPRLNVSEQKIDHLGVAYDEDLLDEIIDVFNEGSGKLDWTATCKSDWIVVESHETYIKLKLNPKTGINRGTIYVKDKNGNGSKTIRITVEKLKKPETVLPRQETAVNTNEKKQETHPLKDDLSTKSEKLLVFRDVKMRHVNQAKSVVDNSEQSGLISVFSNKIVFIGNTNVTIKNIDVLDYYPQDINPGYTYNYMGISGEYNGVKKIMYFYIFSWFGAGQTWKMAEQIHGLIKNKKLAVATNFKTHINSNKANQNTTTNVQPPKKTTAPPQQNNIYLPGSWNIYIYQFGQQISYLNLYFNIGGALSGTQQSADGFSQISGTWGYNPNNRLLKYNVMVLLASGSVPDHGSVSLQRDGNGNVSGTDHLGRQWTLQKTGN